MRNNLVKYGLILLAITAIAALVLSYVNGITKERIAALETQSEGEARGIVMGDIAFDKEVELGASQNPLIKGIWEYSKNGGIVGYAVNVVTVGYGGDINMMVGIDATQHVRGVNIVSFSETPGLGSKAQDKAFLGQYRGKAAGVTVKKGGKPEATEVVAISGATVTSAAVTKGVNEALDEVNERMEARGNEPREDI